MVKNIACSQIDFYYTKHQIIVFNNSFVKLFFRTVFENSYQIRP